MRIGNVSGSSFSIGGSGHTNTVNHYGAGAAAAAPTAEELLEAVQDLRAALVRLPRSTDRSELDAELDEAAGDLEEAEEIRPGVVARLRGALDRWAPLVETIGAAGTLAGLLTTLGG
ncbi:hypothetical protein [Streptomyces antimicrobicus]|uniref:ABC transporter substrate-binding protein n=1 Tax=Streptomyces antimicrobicus TaxID=2883108 RepID=A0ABS8B5S1_9ACTN|nr:hypothetical protein [Streptomyces antimicrobicus]MCB5179954.1 hypothetical protein [Streptomyces antimicrobicus]